ncbi:type II secretion system protein GspM [uncultured Sphaerotilus sp.]|uniref:type II secretion system protein GspM n=1 Tax=uncultured Sphaerotilus sp. TaxID=474984 RepID=UPI0030CA3301
MNTALSRTDAFRQQLAPLQQRWQALAPRERLGATLGAGLVLVFLLWTLGVQPALKTLRTAPVQQAALDAQLAQMQRLAAEAVELRALPPVDPAQADAALQSATERLGAAARLQRSGERVSVTFTSVEPAAMMGWLAEVRAAARVRVVEAQLGRTGNGYSGSVVLTLPTPATTPR